MTKSTRDALEWFNQWKWVSGTDADRHSETIRTALENGIIKDTKTEEKSITEDTVLMNRGDLEKLHDALKMLAMQKSHQELREYYGDDEYEGDTEYAYDWFVQKSRETLSILEAALGEKK